MAKKPRVIPKELIEAVSPATIEALSHIAGIRVIADANDAIGVLRAGAVLLAISRVDNDEEGDGFRFLFGLRRGTTIGNYLGNFFS
jgi:hypothetical protein